MAHTATMAAPNWMELRCWSFSRISYLCLWNNGFSPQIRGMVGEMRFLTTGQAARYCGVTRPTVIAKLDSIRLDIHSHRRVPVSEVVDYLSRNKQPIPAELCANYSL